MEKLKVLLDDLHVGLVLFLTTAYLLFIIPSLLVQAGLSFQEAFTVTALSIAIPTAIGAFLTKRPFVFGPGVALTAYLVFTVVASGISYDVVLAAVVVEGLILLALSISNLRELVAKAFPKSLINGAIAGIGLYLIFLGFRGMGIVDDLGMVNLSGPSIIALGVLLAATLLFLRQVGGSFLLAILLGYIVAVAAGLAPLPTDVWSAPALPSVRPNFFGADSFSLLSVVLAILLIDFFDTLGVSTAILSRIDKGLSRVKEVFLSDAIGTIAAGFLGAPSVAAYVESAVAADKPRGAVPAYVAAALFLLSLFFAPLFSAIPYYLSAAILVIIGTMMFSTLRPINKAPDELLPMVVTTALIPMTGSIAMGIMAGIFFYISTKLLVGKAKDVHPILILITILIILDVVNAL